LYSPDFFASPVYIHTLRIKTTHDTGNIPHLYTVTKIRHRAGGRASIKSLHSFIFSPQKSRLSEEIKITIVI
jgi:hypothetical protein